MSRSAPPRRTGLASSMPFTLRLRVRPMKWPAWRSAACPPPGRARGSRTSTRRGTESSLASQASKRARCRAAAAGRRWRPRRAHRPTASGASAGTRRRSETWRVAGRPGCGGCVSGSGRSGSDPVPAATSRVSPSARRQHERPGRRGHLGHRAGVAAAAPDRRLRRSRCESADEHRGRHQRPPSGSHTAWPAGSAHHALLAAPRKRNTRWNASGRTVLEAEERGDAVVVEDQLHVLAAARGDVAGPRSRSARCATGRPGCELLALAVLAVADVLDARLGELAAQRRRWTAGAPWRAGSRRAGMRRRSPSGVVEDPLGLRRRRSSWPCSRGSGRRSSLPWCRRRRRPRAPAQVVEAQGEQLLR